MPVRSQLQIAEQMVAQIRLLEPSISAEVGTPERMILDVVSGAIAEDSIDLVGLQQALNIDSKFGVNLTNFLSIFGFARQESTKATGYVVFSLAAASNRAIQIPKETLIKSHESTTPEGLIPEYITTAAAFIRPGETESAAIPIECTRPGEFGNVAANMITVFFSPEIGPLLGVTGVTNPAPTTHGADQEDDNSLKVRFKNTVFRNMAGTHDQFLALSIATSFTTKANVVGPVSRYQEYVQVPQNEEEPTKGDDASSLRFGGEGGSPYPGYPAPIVRRGTTTFGSKFLNLSDTTGIKPGDVAVIYEEGDNPKPLGTIVILSVETTTRLFINPSPYTVTNAWVTIGETDPTPFINKWTSGLSTNVYAKTIFPELSVFISTEASGISKYFFREGTDFVFNFPPKLQGDTYRAMLDGTGNDPREGLGLKQPNITFINVYQGAEPEAVTALAPGTVALLEYSYTSTASRNDLERNVSNAVDVFIDGSNEQQTSTVFAVPVAPKAFEFVDEPNSKFYYENYRRAGEPSTRPIEGNVLIQLFNQPVLNIPEQIVVGTNVYYRNVHYWLVQDVSPLGGTIRARDGIEWSATLPADSEGSQGRPTEVTPEPSYTGVPFVELESGALVNIEKYTCDQNVGDLQAALEGARQITTDVLAHSARKRYFKLDITVVYSSKASAAAINEEIGKAVDQFFTNQFFGSIIRLSDLLQHIHNTAGVENVRWSNDVPHTRNLIRVYETDIQGRPLRGIFTERIQNGHLGNKPIDAIYIVGNPNEGKFGIKYDHTITPSVKIKPLAAATIESELNTHWLPAGWSATVEEDTRSTVDVRFPIRSFRVHYNKTEPLLLPTVVYNPESPIQGDEFIFDSDFYLRDDELPTLPTGTQKGDTVPGLIIRSRAQNVFQKAG